MRICQHISVPADVGNFPISVILHTHARCLVLLTVCFMALNFKDKVAYEHRRDVTAHSPVSDSCLCTVSHNE